MSARDTSRSAEYSREGASEGAEFAHKGTPDLSGEWGLDALGQILKKLEGARTVAYFLVSDGLSEKCVFFPAGGLRVSSVGARRGRRLVDTIRADPNFQPAWESAIKAALSATDEGGPGSLEALEGPVREAMKNASRRVVRDELLDLLVWRDAQFEFRLTNPPPAIFSPDLEAVKLSLGVRSLLEEIGEKIKVWRRMAPKIGDPARTLVTLRGKPRATSRGLRGAYSLLDRSPNKQASFDDVLVAGRRGGAPDALHLAQELLDAGEQGSVLIEVTPKAPSESYKKQRAKRRTTDLEAALALLMDKLTAHKRLAQEYTQLGDQDRAVANWRIVGEELRAREDYEGAIDVYQNVLAGSPMAFFAREELANLFKQLGRGSEAVGQWLRLARDFAKFKLFNRAQAPLRLAIAEHPDDPDLRRYLIDSLEANGDQGAAEVEWDRLAKLYEGLGQMQEALACYQALHERNPDDEGAQAALYAAAKPQVPVMGILVLSLALFLLLSASAFVYLRFQTLSAFRDAREQALASAHVGQYEEARGALIEFRAVHDYSPERIDSVISVIDELEAADAAQALERGKAHDQAGRRLEALRLYKAVAKGYPKTPAGQEAAALGGAIEDQLASLDERASSVERLIEGKKFREAFTKGRELINTGGWAPRVQALKIPVKLETRPPGASVVIAGEPEEGLTPRVLLLPWGAPVELQVSAQGHEDVRITLDLRAADAPDSLSVVLPRRVRWTRTTGGPIQAPPAAVAGKVLAVSTDQTLYAYGRDGRLEWRYPKEPSADRLRILVGVRGAPLLTPSSVFVVDRESLRVLSAKTGALIKAVSVPRGTRALGLIGEQAILVSPRQVSAYDGQGVRAWAARLPGVRVGASLDEAKARVLVTTRNNLLCVVDAAAGKAFRPFKLPSRPLAAAQAAPGGAVLVREGKVLELRWSKLVWSVELPSEATHSPLVEEGRVHVACGDQLLTYTLGKGKEIWRKGFSSRLGAPRAGEGNVYVAAQRGQLWALHGETGEVRWEFPVRAEVFASPTPSEDLIFLGGGDSKLYAIPN